MVFKSSLNSCLAAQEAACYVNKQCSHCLFQVSPPMFLYTNFWVVDLILGSKNHLIEKKIDNSSNKMIVM